MASQFGDVPKLKKKVRRYIPKEENLQGIKDVIKDIGDEDITVDQFVALVSQHTADRGAVLTKVITEDLNSFHKMVVKVYETMTQDVSDVLANEQMELAKMYDEKHSIILNKIMQNCKELKEIYPPFNFEDFYYDPDAYIENAFVVPELPDDEEVDTVKRHLAYHRLQWLQSERERLKAENAKLQKRLAQLKKDQRQNLKKAVKNEVEVEKQHLELSQAEHFMHEKLEDLGQTIQELIVDEDKQETARKKTAVKKRGETKKRIKKKKAWEDIEFQTQEDNWNVSAAQEIETTQLADHLQSDISRMAISASSIKISPQSKFDSTNLAMKQNLVDSLNASVRDLNSEGFGSKESKPLSPKTSARVQYNKSLSRQRSPQKQQYGRCGSKAPQDTWGDRQKAVKWMRKLSTCTDSIGEMKLRNDFMYYLVINIQNYELQPPFNSEPPVGTLLDYEHLLPRGKDISASGLQAGQDEDDGDESARPFLYQHSPDGGAFLASQPIPRCGAFCYLAVVSHSTR